jgi:hypothetical protein
MVSNMDSDMGVDTDTDVDVLRAAGQHVTAGGWVQWQWADRQCYVAHAMAASDCAAEGSGGSEGRIGRTGSGVMLITGSTWWQ